MRILLAAAGLALLVPSAFAQTQASTLAPGEYVREGGWGYLTLRAGPRGAQPFEIQAYGANAHTCELDGRVANGKATLEAMEKNDPCIVTFTAVPEGVVVDPTESCKSYYCGVRARFEGLYLRPAPGCAPKAVRATRDEFKKLYDAKRHAEARDKLEPILKNCARTTSDIQGGSIRNDLAVTLHKMKDFTACRAVLEPLAEEAKMTDEQLRGQYPPADADNHVDLARATRTNLKLCKSPS
ncbi:hypothetical protein BWI17_02850 [Betaproteobacteria bacterium GR16-43]|nr:hypothetical protein BWI17_02850 [Betaproteobacteria bacterium GR16-43]